MKNSQLLYKAFLLSCSLFFSSMALARYEVELNAENKLTFGGYIKLDARYVNGNINSIVDDYWVGAGNVGDISRFNFTVTETRFNTQYVHDDLMGFIELDFHGAGGNEIVSNSDRPRIRHAFIKYQNFLFGQTWSTFVDTSAIAETADFGGPLNGSAFIRQSQIRLYQQQFSIGYRKSRIR